MRRTTRLVHILCAGVVASCTQILGVSDYGVRASSPDAAAACQDFGMPDGACRTCQLASCCDESQECASDAACASFARCLAGCSSHDDGDCLAACYQTP